MSSPLTPLIDSAEFPTQSPLDELSPDGGISPFVSILPPHLSEVSEEELPATFAFATIPVRDSKQNTNSNSNPFASITQDELVLNALKFLCISELAKTKLVCAKWYHLSSSDELWEKFFKQHLQQRTSNLSFMQIYMQRTKHEREREAKHRNSIAHIKRMRRLTCHPSRFNDDKYSSYGFNIAKLYAPSLNDFTYLEQPVHSTLNLLRNVADSYSITLKNNQTSYHSDVNTKVIQVSENLAKCMFTRFEMFMYLKRKYAKQLLVPTLDIEFVWQCLLLRPAKYLDYCKERNSALSSDYIIDHYFVAMGTGEASLQALEDTQKLWKQEFNCDYLNCSKGTAIERVGKEQTQYVMENYDNILEWQQWVTQTHKLANDGYNKLFPRVEDNFMQKYVQWGELQDWVNKTPTFTYRTFTIASEKYGRWFKLNAKLAASGKKMIAPNTMLDNFWHAHMMHPVQYLHDCIKVYGNLLDHVIEPTKYKTLNEEEQKDKDDEKKCEYRNKVWSQEFGEPFEQTKQGGWWDD